MIDTLPTPHGDKLRALLANAKLPRTDKPRVSATIERYASWLTEMEETKDRHLEYKALEYQMRVRREPRNSCPMFQRILSERINCTDVLTDSLIKQLNLLAILLRVT